MYAASTQSLYLGTVSMAGVWVVVLPNDLVLVCAKRNDRLDQADILVRHISSRGVCLDDVMSAQCAIGSSADLRLLLRSL
jgi:hypothetical protein